MVSLAVYLTHTKFAAAGPAASCRIKGGSPGSLCQPVTACAVVQQLPDSLHLKCHSTVPLTQPSCRVIQWKSHCKLHNRDSRNYILCSTWPSWPTLLQHMPVILRQGATREKANATRVSDVALQHTGIPHCSSITHTTHTNLGPLHVSL